MKEPTRSVVVNADDLGLSEGVNRGIIEAHERGILTSASLMVRQKGLSDAAAYCQNNRTLGVGLHVDLGEWRLVSGEWIQAYEVVPLHDAEAVEREITHQIRRFEEALGRKPTHLDSHQHVHRREPVRGIMERLAGQLGIPLRGFSTIYSCGAFYGQLESGVSEKWMIGAENLVRILHELPADKNEVSCHPGFADDIDSDYSEERALEVSALCDPRVLAAVGAEGIRLVTFAAM